MKTDRRELNIISLLESRGEMSINSLSQILGVSLSTLRKQLAVMQKKGLVKKRTDVYNNKYKDSMSLIRERRLYENKESGYNEQN